MRDVWKTALRIKPKDRKGLGMAFVVEFNGFMLDEKSGKFTAENGNEIEYRNARFYDTDHQAIYKVKVPKDSILPDSSVPCTVYLSIEVTERYCSAYFEGVA